jgi:hypothetical protein
MDVTKILAQLKAEREQLEILQGEGHIERRGKPPSWIPPSNDPQTPPNTPAAAALSRIRRGNVWAVAGRKPPLWS